MAVREVLLDTNALLLPFRERFPLEAELGRAAAGVPGSCPTPPSESSSTWRNGGRRAPRRRSAGRAGSPSVESPGSGDASILALAVRRGAVVVTADRGFSVRLRAAGVGVLSPRGRSTLVLLRAEPADERATVKNRSRLQRRQRPVGR